MAVSNQKQQNFNANTTLENNQGMSKKPVSSIIDSGANGHMFCSNTYLKNLDTKKTENNIGTANGDTSTISEVVDTVSISFKENIELPLQKPIYAPSLKFNLVSVSKLTKHGLRSVFETNYCILEKGELFILKVYKDCNDLYRIPEECFKKHIALSATDYNILHAKSCHTVLENLK